MAITYEVQHPAMSEPLIIESEVPRMPRALAAHAVMYILRHFDEALDVESFTVSRDGEPLNCSPGVGYGLSMAGCLDSDECPERCPCESCRAITWAMENPD